MDKIWKMSSRNFTIGQHTFVHVKSVWQLQWHCSQTLYLFRTCIIKGTILPNTAFICCTICPIFNILLRHVATLDVVVKRIVKTHIFAVLNRNLILGMLGFHSMCSVHKLLEVRYCFFNYIEYWSNAIAAAGLARRFKNLFCQFSYVFSAVFTVTDLKFGGIAQYVMCLFCSPHGIDCEPQSLHEHSIIRKTLWLCLLLP